ncbi:MAG: redoxin domain-containing protein [Planctomycetaceae bacterium]|nr:redoxin domain-containing protein [Planctomycetaceae bacterium]
MSDMIGIGSLAPSFDCTAIANGRFVELNWQQLHQDQVLVLLFDSVESSSNLLTEIAELRAAQAQFARLKARLYVVCRDPADELLSANFPFPLLLDPDNEIACLYDMLLPDGTMLWGQCIVDADGFVQRFVQCDVPASSSVAELIHYVAAVRDSETTQSPC